MGCCQSSTAARATSAADQGRIADSALPARESPVLTELSDEEKALTQLKLIFDAVDVDENSSVSKTELTAALETNQNLVALIKKAGLNENFYVLNQLDTNNDHRITWAEFESNLKKEAVQEVAESGQVAAAELPVEEKVFKRLRELFDNLDADDDGAVNKEELAAGLKKDKDEHGLMKDMSLGKLIEQAGLNPYWDVLESLDTNKDGKIAWEEFEAHLRSVAKQEVQETGDVGAAVVLEETMAAQTCVCSLPFS